MASNFHYHVEATFGFCIHFNEQKAQGLIEGNDVDVAQWWAKVVPAVYSLLTKNPALLSKVMQVGALQELGYEIAAGDGSVLVENTLTDCHPDADDFIEQLFKPYVDKDPDTHKLLLNEDSDWAYSIQEIVGCFEYTFVNFDIHSENVSPKPAPKRGLHA